MDAAAAAANYFSTQNTQIILMTSDTNSFHVFRFISSNIVNTSKIVMVCTKRSNVLKQSKYGGLRRKYGVVENFGVAVICCSLSFFTFFFVFCHEI